MKYLEFIQDEETQLVKMIRIREDAVEQFFQQMEAAEYEECVELIKSLYVEVLIYTVENLVPGEGFKMAELNGRLYEIHNHMFTAYLVSFLYDSQYWDILIDIIASFRNAPDDDFSLTFFNLYEKLTEEPIENFVKEVRLVNPSYRVK